jgi:hypothetical protein
MTEAFNALIGIVAIFILGLIALGAVALSMIENIFAMRYQDKKDKGTNYDRKERNDIFDEADVTEVKTKWKPVRTKDGSIIHWRERE